VVYIPVRFSTFYICQVLDVACGRERAAGRSYPPQHRQDFKLDSFFQVMDVRSDVLCRYLRKFTPTAWRVVSRVDLTHDSRKTMEYAYGSMCNVPPRFAQAKEDLKWEGPQSSLA